MEFREAMDALGLSAVELEEALGVSAQTIRQMRLDPDNAGYRAPPANWRDVLAKAARARGDELSGVAEQLEREAKREAGKKYRI